MEQFKKSPAREKQNVLFCTRIQQVKLHESKLQSLKNAPCKKSKINAPSAAILWGLRKLAAYHCQMQFFTTNNKVSNKVKFRVANHFDTGSLAGIGIDIPYTVTGWSVFRLVF
jgi:hypothetical protein